MASLNPWRPAAHVTALRLDGARNRREYGSQPMGSLGRTREPWSMRTQLTSDTSRRAKHRVPRTGYYLVGTLLGAVGAVALAIGAPAGFSWALIVFGAGLLTV